MQGRTQSSKVGVVSVEGDYSVAGCARESEGLRPFELSIVTLLHGSNDAGASNEGTGGQQQRA